MFTIKGKTVEGKPVISGLFKFYETEGIPLEAVFAGVKVNGLVPCWMSFHQEARTAGMSHARILSKLEPALDDSFGYTFRCKVMEGLNALYRAGRLT